MQLVLSIVQDADAEPLMADLVAAGYRATRMAATGGFLRRGNHVVLVGVKEEALENVLSIIRGRCQTRRYRTKATAVPIASEIPPTVNQVTVGGATVFVLNAVRMEPE